jgi:hypothetical protein
LNYALNQPIFAFSGSTILKLKEGKRALFKLGYRFVLFLIPVIFLGNLCSGDAVIDGSDKVDFGSYPANQRKKAVFKLVNQGDGILRILKIRKTCGCSDVKIDKTELKPGETGIITASIKANSITGAFHKKFYVQTDDSHRAFLGLSLTGNSVPLVKVQPKDKIHLGTLTAGKLKTQDFILKKSSSKGEIEYGEPKLKNFKQATVKFDKQSGKLSVDLQPVEAGAFKLELDIPVVKPEGWEPIQIILTGRVKK